MNNPNHRAHPQSNNWHWERHIRVPWEKMDGWDVGATTISIKITTQALMGFLFELIRVVILVASSFSQQNTAKLRLN